jgi:hypothetical protein
MKILNQRVKGGGAAAFIDLATQFLIKIQQGRRI